MEQGKIWGKFEVAEELTQSVVEGLMCLLSSPQPPSSLSPASPAPPPHTLRSQLQSHLHFANKTLWSCLMSARPHFYMPDSFQGRAIPGCPEEESFHRKPQAPAFPDLPFFFLLPILPQFADVFLRMLPGHVMLHSILLHHQHKLLLDPKASPPTLTTLCNISEYGEGEHFGANHLFVAILSKKKQIKILLRWKE